jgi:hypothetical protein
MTQITTVSKREAKTNLLVRQAAVYSSAILGSSAVSIPFSAPNLILMRRIFSSRV